MCFNSRLIRLCYVWCRQVHEITYTWCWFYRYANEVDIQTNVVPERGEQIPIRIVIDADAWTLRKYYIDEIKVVAKELEVKYVDVLNDNGKTLARLTELQKVKSTYTVAGFQFYRGHPLDEIKFRYTRLGVFSRSRVFVKFIPINTANKYTPKSITKVSVASVILRNGYGGFPVIKYEQKNNQ